MVYDLWRLPVWIVPPTSSFSTQRKNSLLQLSANEMTPAVQVVAALGWKLWFWHLWQCILMSCGRGLFFCHDVQLLQWANTMKTGVSETTSSLICCYIFLLSSRKSAKFCAELIFEVNVFSVCTITFLRCKARKKNKNSKGQRLPFQRVIAYPRWSFGCLGTGGNIFHVILAFYL